MGQIHVFVCSFKAKNRVFEFDCQKTKLIPDRLMFEKIMMKSVWCVIQQIKYTREHVWVLSLYPEHSMLDKMVFDTSLNITNVNSWLYTYCMTFSAPIATSKCPPLKWHFIWTLWACINGKIVSYYLGLPLGVPTTSWILMADSQKA